MQDTGKEHGLAHSAHDESQACWNLVKKTAKLKYQYYMTKETYEQHSPTQHILHYYGFGYIKQFIAHIYAYTHTHYIHNFSLSEAKENKRAENL